MQFELPPNSLLIVHMQVLLPTIYQLHYYVYHTTIDIPLSEYGTLLGLYPSMKFLPEKFVKRIRSCYVHLMVMLTLDHENELHWKRLELIPLLLHTKCSKPELQDRIMAILNDEWNFTLGQFEIKKKVTTKNYY